LSTMRHYNSATPVCRWQADDQCCKHTRHFFRTELLKLVNLDRLLIHPGGIDRLVIFVGLDDCSLLVQKHLMKLCTYTIAVYSEVLTYNCQD
jgi:hypothetical protein